MRGPKRLGKPHRRQVDVSQDRPICRGRLLGSGGLPSPMFALLSPKSADAGCERVQYPHVNKREAISNRLHSPSAPAGHIFGRTGRLAWCQVSEHHG